MGSFFPFLKKKKKQEIPPATASIPNDIITIAMEKLRVAGIPFNYEETTELIKSGPTKKLIQSFKYRQTPIVSPAFSVAFGKPEKERVMENKELEKKLQIIFDQIQVQINQHTSSTRPTKK
jgi:hypothetical protein